MKNPKLLVKIANDTAESYLTNKIDMNTTIVKRASENNLTKEEIQRIVEFANTKAYLELRKTAEQNYVDFDVADSNKILTDLKLVEPESEKTTSPISTYKDYKTPPIKKASFEKAAEEKCFEKTAEEFIQKEVPAFEKTINSMENELSSDKLQYDTRINKLTNSVRQLLLQGAEASSLKSMFDVVDKSGKIWETIISKLSDEFPMVKNASIEGTSKVVNTDHPLVKEAYETSILMGKLAVNSIMLDAVKTAYADETNMLKQASIAKMHPIVKGMGAVTLGAILYGLGSKHATQAAMRDKLDYYNRQRPGRNIQ